MNCDIWNECKTHTHTQWNMQYFLYVIYDGIIFENRAMYCDYNQLIWNMILDNALTD